MGSDNGLSALRATFARNHVHPSRDEANAFASPSGKGSLVVIPAHDEADVIGRTLRDVMASGVPKDRILVVDSRSTDGTSRIAREFGVTVVDQEAEIARRLRADVMRRFGTTLDPAQVYCGKGTALLAALLHLGAQGAPDNLRLFLLDADLRNVAEVNPLCYLGFADERTGGRLAAIKCAHPARENEIPLAILNALKLAMRGSPVMERYAGVSALTWPLSGQMMVRLGALRKVPLASGYSVELVTLMGLLDTVGLEGIGQVWVQGRIQDKLGPPDKYIKMYAMIAAMVMAILRQSNGLIGLQQDDYRALNETMVADEMLVTHPDGPNVVVATQPEQLIPPYEALVAAGAIDFAR